MQHPLLIEPEELLDGAAAVVFDCRFALSDPQAGHAQYALGHVPGAFHLDLNRDLSATPGQHGGRHPLPDPQALAARLADCGVGRETAVVVYDDNRFAFAARLWWLMRSLGYRPPRLLNGGYRAWLLAGGEQQRETPSARPCAPPAVDDYAGRCDIDGLRQAQQRGAVLVDVREARRYAGLEEPIDPVAGHIPGARNHPWQGVTSDEGWVAERNALVAHWGDTIDSEELVVYCGSGVTACVSLFSLALLGRQDATLYAGSWSDWCSYL